MLKQLTLGNFKPIHQKICLDLGGVTVLAGLNSSGKSSIIQAILLLSQTFSHSGVERCLVPNGTLVQLGPFAQVRNDLAKTEPVTLGFHMILPMEDYRWSYPGMKSDTVCVEVSFLPSDEENTVSKLSGGVILHNISINISYFHRQIKIAAEPMTSEQLTSFLANVIEGDADRWRIEHGTPLSVEISSTDDGISRERNSEGGLRAIAGVHHFMPERISRKLRFRFNEDRRRALATFVKAMTDTQYPETYAQEILTSSRFAISDSTIKDCVDFTIKSLSKTGKTVRYPNAKYMPDVFIRWLRMTIQHFSGSDRRISNLRTGILKRLREAAERDHGSNTKFELIPIQSIEGAILENVTKGISSYFSERVRYLGPLRVDPHALQSFSQSSELYDVGSKGQYAAAVYDANKDRRVVWWNPDLEIQDNSTLKYALDVWVRHLGVAHHIHASEAHENGFSWRVQARLDAPERPLSAVGVGVSQVLPILVAGLLAPSGCLLLFEQPELHLHVRAQARLADFFVGLLRTGRQCIVETHSDCFVNQLRLHIARRTKSSEGVQSSPDLLDEGDIKIYFVKQDNTGSACLSPIKISPSGNISNWPDGFFDENVRQEEKIMRESLSFRSRRKVE